MTKRNRQKQAIWVVVILVVGLGASLFIPGVRRLLVSSNSDRAFALMNHDRTSHGLHALAHNSQLQSYAQSWANHMAKTHVLEHDHIEDHICCYIWLGENVGSGPSLEDIESEFMKSPPHRHNILLPQYTQAGVAVAISYDKNHNPIYWVDQAFRDPTRSASRSRPKPAPRRTVSHRPIPRRTAAPTLKASVIPTPTPSPTPSPTVSVVLTPSPLPVVTPSHRVPVRSHDAANRILFVSLIVLATGLLLWFYNRTRRGGEMR